MPAENGRALRGLSRTRDKTVNPYSTGLTYTPTPLGPRRKPLAVGEWPGIGFHFAVGLLAVQDVPTFRTSALEQVVARPTQRLWPLADVLGPTDADNTHPEIRLGMAIAPVLLIGRSLTGERCIAN